MGQDIANPNFHNVTDGDNMPYYHTHMRLHVPKSVDQVLTATINNYLRHTPLSEPRSGSAQRTLRDRSTPLWENI
jgi:hypothetical protein